MHLTARTALGDRRRRPFRRHRDRTRAQACHFASPHEGAARAEARESAEATPPGYTCGDVSDDLAVTGFVETLVQERFRARKSFQPFSAVGLSFSDPSDKIPGVCSAFRLPEAAIPPLDGPTRRSFGDDFFDPCIPVPFPLTRLSRQDSNTRPVLGMPRPLRAYLLTRSPAL